VEEAEQTRRVLAAVESLPAMLGRTVALRYLDGLSYAEVAAALDVPVSTVKSRLFKSHARLRLLLESEFGGSRVKPEASRISKKGRTAMTAESSQTVTAATAVGQEPAPSAPPRRPERHCSFCGKEQKQVRRMIAGPRGVYICNECVGMCSALMSLAPPPSREENAALVRRYIEEVIDAGIDPLSDDGTPAFVRRYTAAAANRNGPDTA
jgi:hypothetical protein